MIVLSVVARLVDIHFFVRENDQCPFTHHFNLVLLLSSSGMAPEGTKLGLTTLPSNTSHAHLALHIKLTHFLLHL